MREVLGRQYKFDPTDKDAVFIWDTAEFDKFIFYFFLAFNIFMGLIGSFTLGVAGIGVANIMYIVVQERIKEIGVKRAVGAPKRAIHGPVLHRDLLHHRPWIVHWLGSRLRHHRGSAVVPDQGLQSARRRSPGK